MRTETKAGKLLKLKKSEESTFGALSGTPQSVAEIANKVNLPRMTVFEALRSLKSRGVAERTLVGKRHLWSNIETYQATGLLQSALDAIIRPSGDGKNRLFIQLYEGAPEIFHMLKNFFVKNTGERLVGIQSTASARACIQALGLEKTTEINKIIKEKNIIVEVVLQGDFAELKKEFGEKWAESYAGRSAAVTFVPQEFLDVSEDIYIFKQSLVIINWSEARMLEIVHPEIVSTFQKLIRSLAMLGRKVDINTLVKETPRQV